MPRARSFCLLLVSGFRPSYGAIRKLRHVQQNFQRRWPEVGFVEIAVDLLQARLNEAASRQTLSRARSQRWV
jgi:hypothetical protein